MVPWTNRRKRMKQGELKRALVVLTILCIFLFIYLYWQQSTDTNPSGNVYSYRHVNNHKKSHSSQWTWQCINQRCERQRTEDAAVPAVSLSTCSMLCGSTQLWPQPTGPVTLGSRAVRFHHLQLRLWTRCAGAALPLLQQAFAIFNDTIVAMVDEPSAEYNVARSTQVDSVLVKVTVLQENIVRLRLGTSEGYNLTVRALADDGRAMVVNIVARTFFGARHALETLSQLIWWDEYDHGGSLKMLKVASVQDAPAFPYRGLMLDTARNFMSMDSLRRVIAAMAASKLNVFHWHITDSQSFPMESVRVPQLAKYGAYGPDQTYTPDEIKTLVAFAGVRGVRIVIEIDAPAHAGNGWNFGPKEGLGELAVCVNERPWSLYCGEPPCGQLNPDNPNVYDILGRLYEDVLEATGEDEIFHLGGDEVNLECWAQHLHKTSTMYNNYTDLHDLWGEFTLKALQRLEVANGHRRVPNVVVWSSNLSKRPYITKYLNKSNIVVQSWGASQWPDTPDLVADGYRVIISHVDAWYLDCGFGRWRETGDAACDPYRTWQTVYNHRPWQQLRHQKDQIVGGEVCLWSEQLDEGSLDARLWPRAAAFAERVWTDPRLDPAAFSIPEDVYTRLSTHRDRLMARGVGAEALWPAWCAQNPGMCL